MDKSHRRRILLEVLSAMFGAAACRHAIGAPTVLESRAVSGFDEVSWDAAGELVVEQTGRESLVVEAEAAVLRKIVTRVHDRRLEISFAPGRIETREPIRFRLQVSTLRRLELLGSGDTRIGAVQTPSLSLAVRGAGNLRVERLAAQTLELHLAGSGDVTISGGAVESQRVALDGSGDVYASQLASRLAEVSIAGSGDIHVAAAQRLAARIAGSGDVLYRGHPEVIQRVTGAGSVQRSGG